MILSVLIISHNQKTLLQRCIESVLQQNLPFEHEIIISDDASTDGTWELAQEYAEKHIEVKAFQCNSDDCQPTITSERSGHNRSNAYNHSSGKYFCHIDADDFYRPGTNCLQEMVEMLESHPDCSICMQNGWILQDGQTLEEGHPYYPRHRFQTGEILTPKQYFNSGIFVNNGAMMMRRNDSVNPAERYHKWYVDSVITNHHLQFGNIVCLDCVDWVYVQYPKSITSSLSANDQTLLWNLDLTVFSSMMVPKFTRYYYTRENIYGLKRAIKIIIHNAPLSLEVKTYCAQFKHTFIFKTIGCSRIAFFDRIRLYLCLLLCQILSRQESGSLLSIIMLNRLCGRTYRF